MANKSESRRSCRPVLFIEAAQCTFINNDLYDFVHEMEISSHAFRVDSVVAKVLVRRRFKFFTFKIEFVICNNVEFSSKFQTPIEPL